MHLKVIAEASANPVDLEMVKEYLRVDYDDEYMLIQSMIGAAVSHVETFTRRTLSQKTYELIVDGFHDRLELPNPPFKTIENVTIITKTGDEVTPDYEIKEREPAVLLIDCVNDVEEMHIEYQAGYDEIPKPIEQAIMLLVSHFYENRESVIVGTSVVKMPFSVEALLYPYKAGWF